VTQDAPVEDAPVEDGSVDHAPASRAFGAGLVVLGAVGLYAAFSLARDKVKILEDPTFKPGCDLNPVLSCGSVMVTDQAEAFGFPNPFLGLVCFSVVVTLGVLMASGVTLPRWVMSGLAIGSLAGAGFVHWLAFQSMYRIGALCPWCLAVWAVTLPIAVWSVLTALRQHTSGRLVAGLWNVRYLVLLAWYLVFVVQILVEFWDYWRTLI
jgi:uncharacterized membrane protein